MDPFAVAADPGGNLYLTDLAARGSHWEEPGMSQPGVLRIDAGAVDALAAGTEPAAGSVTFIPIRSLPTGIVYSSKEDALYFVTGNDVYDLGGAVLRLPRGDFTGASAIQTVAKDLTALSSIGFSPKGTALAGRMSGDIVQIRGRRGRPISFRDRHLFLSPGQIATTRLDDGKVLVVVPEASGAGLGQWQHRVYTFLLPADI
jgi:hypothetical protein